MADNVPTEVRCPLVDETIEAGDCIVTRDVADDHFDDKSLPARFKIKSDWRDICRQCEWHHFN